MRSLLAALVREDGWGVGWLLGLGWGWRVEYKLIFCLIFSYPSWFSENVFVPPHSDVANRHTNRSHEITTT